MHDRNDVKEQLAHGDIAHLLRKMAIPGVISQILLLLYTEDEKSGSFRW